MAAPHVRPDFDLQSHSVHSDGALPAAEVVALAAAAGMRLMALTDHDTVDGVPEGLRAAADRGVRCSPAAELSAVEGDFEDLHVLGYELRHDDATLRDTLADFRADRGRRIHAMADRLEELGFVLDRAGLEARERAGSPLGRPHLAEAVLENPANSERLREEGIAGKRELFPAYLVPGAIAYVARSRPTVPEAIEVIHGAGGVAVWAHPFWDVNDARHRPRHARAVRRRRARRGGVLLRHPHGGADPLLHDAARRLGLLTTGSTDFHGPDHETFSGFGGFELYGLEPDLGPMGGSPAPPPDRLAPAPGCSHDGPPARVLDRGARRPPGCGRDGRLGPRGGRRGHPPRAQPAHAVREPAAAAGDGACRPRLVGHRVGSAHHRPRAVPGPLPRWHPGWRGAPRSSASCGSGSPPRRPASPCAGRRASRGCSPARCSRVPKTPKPHV